MFKQYQNIYDIAKYKTKYFVHTGITELVYEISYWIPTYHYISKGSTRN